MNIISNAFQKLLPYLGSRGTNIFATLLFIIMVRIGFAYVVKFFRFHFDYHSPQKNSGSHKDNKSDIDKIVKDFHQKIGD